MSTLIPRLTFTGTRSRIRNATRARSLPTGTRHPGCQLAQQRLPQPAPRSRGDVGLCASLPLSTRLSSTLRRPVTVWRPTYNTRPEDHPCETVVEKWRMLLLNERNPALTGLRYSPIAPINPTPLHHSLSHGDGCRVERPFSFKSHRIHGERKRSGRGLPLMTATRAGRALCHAWTQRRRACASAAAGQHGGCRLAPLLAILCS